MATFGALVKAISKTVGRLEHAGDPLEAIAILRKLDGDVDVALRAVVTDARERGHSWGELAQRLGTTRQAAHQRYSAERGR